MCPLSQGAEVCAEEGVSASASVLQLSGPTGKSSYPDGALLGGGQGGGGASLDIHDLVVHKIPLPIAFL